MNDHPLLLLLFVMANVTSAAGFAFVAVGILPGARGLSVRTRRSGQVASIAAAGTHLVLAMVVLFADKTTAGQMSANVGALILHAIVAGALWVFLFGLYVERENRIRTALRRGDSELPDPSSAEEPRP